MPITRTSFKQTCVAYTLVIVFVHTRHSLPIDSFFREYICAEDCAEMLVEEPVYPGTHP